MAAFTREFNKRTGKWPGELTADYHMSTLALVQAIKNAATTDTDKVISAMEDLTFTSTILGDIISSLKIDAMVGATVQYTEPELSSLVSILQNKGRKNPLI